MARLRGTRSKRGRPWLLLALAGCSGWLLGGRSTEAACCDPSVPSSVQLLSTQVPRDGVLAIRLGAEVDLDLELAHERLRITVHDAEDRILAGTLEVHGDFDIAAWRPAESWTPGATLRVQWAYDLDELPSGCTPPEGSVEFEILDDMLSTVDPPVVFLEEHTVTPRDELDAIVCCDGAYPYEYEPGSGHRCHTPSEQILVDEGMCAALTGVGSIVVWGAVDRDALPAHDASNFTSRLLDVDDGEPLRARSSLRREEPVCVRLEVLDLARASSSVHTSCHGDEVVSVLGNLELDPTERLSTCEGTPYTCAISAGTAWDPQRCSPWPEAEVGANDPAEPHPQPGGCGCTESPSSRGFALGLFLLLRRRTARRVTPLGGHCRMVTACATKGRSGPEG